MGRLTKDLIVVFGFSKLNATIAVSLYRENKLEENELKFLYYLETHPFKGNCLINKDLPSVLTGMIGGLEHLNYKITCAGGDAV